jgi:hypothetical protein
VADSRPIYWQGGETVGVQRVLQPFQLPLVEFRHRISFVPNGFRVTEIMLQVSRFRRLAVTNARPVAVDYA